MSVFCFFSLPPVSGSLFLQKVRGFPTSADFLGSNMALKGVKVRMGTPKDQYQPPKHDLISEH